MSGVGSTNAMKKGSGNNPFLAYSEVDMQNYLNSAYVGCIVKYAGPSTRTPVPRGHRLSLGDAQNLVVDLTKKFTYSNTSYKPRRWDIGIETENSVNRIQDILVDSKTGIIGSGRNDIKALIYGNDTSFYGKNINDISVKFLAVSNEYVDRKVIVNWPVTYGNNGWQSDCFNDSGKITLWGYGETVTAYQDENNIDYWDNSVVIYTEPYAVNKLYKVVYAGNGQYYFEELYYISENVTTATVEDAAPGKTFYDFTGTKQTGTGTKINPYLATDIATFKSFPVGSFIKWLGPNKTILDETTGQMLIQDEVYRAVEDGDTFQYAILPTLSNPADPIDVAEGKEVINQLGAVMIGTGNNILQASTTAGMQALFIDANIGKIAKYVGETDVYIKDAFYLITSDANAKQYYELPVLTNEGTAADLALGKELINSKGIKIVGTKLFIGLDETSWEKIREIVLAGKAADYWNIGDTKSITSKSGKTYTIRLVDLQDGRYEYSDGSGSSKAVFEFVECYNLNNTIGCRMNSTDTNVGGWAASEMRSQTMPTLLADLPDDMVAVMSQVKVLSSIGGKNKTDTSSSNNTLFIPATIELFDNKEDSIGLAESPLGQFDYYKANNIDSARAKYVVGETTMIPSKAKVYWNRSPYAYGSNAFCGVDQFGSWDLSDANTTNVAIALIFAI